MSFWPGLRFGGGTAGEELTESSSRRIVATMPGCLMYRVESPVRDAPAELDVARQVRCLEASASLTGIPSSQRMPLLMSIAQTIGRANYHFHRFRAQREALDQIRAWAPGDIFYDAAGATMHYELQAMAGASRLLVDEVIFLIERRCQGNGWKASRVMRSPILAGSAMDVPEVHRLRNRHLQWFDLLNAYRNTFFHSGWAHGSGHFDDGRRAAESPRMNALRVPDRASLSGNSRPYDWTYNDKTTVDDIANDIFNGMVAMVDDLCSSEWGTNVPPPGEMSEQNQPNLMVSVPTPITLVIPDGILVPLFLSHESAMDFVKHVPGLEAKVNDAAVELLRVHSNPDVTPPQEVISLSFRQLDPSLAGRAMHVCFDPFRSTVLGQT